MPAGSSIYGKGYYDGSEDGYDKGYDEGSAAGTLIGTLIGAGATACATGVIALGVWVSPKVKAALAARHRKRLEENPPPAPDLDDTDEGGPTE